MWAKLLSLLSALFLRLLDIRQKNVAKREAAEDRGAIVRQQEEQKDVLKDLQKTVTRTDDNVVNDLNNQFGWKPLK